MQMKHKMQLFTFKGKDLIKELLAAGCSIPLLENPEILNERKVKVLWPSKIRIQNFHGCLYPQKQNHVAWNNVCVWRKHVHCVRT